MSKQIRRRFEVIEDRFGKMSLRDLIRVDGGPDTDLHKAAHGGDCTQLKVLVLVDDKVWMYEEIMTNDDNLESNLLTSSLLKTCSLYKFCYR